MQKILVVCLLLGFHYGDCQVNFICWTPSSSQVSTLWFTPKKKLVNVDSLLSCDDNSCICSSFTDTFSYSVETNFYAQLISVTQPYGVREPIGFYFSNNNGQKQLHDLSNGNATLSVRVKNTSNYNILVYPALVDSSGNEIDAIVSKIPDLQIWEELVWFAIPKGDSITIDVNWNKNAYKGILGRTLEFAVSHPPKGKIPLSIKKQWLELFLEL